jgi:hypothetical protein
VTRWVSQWLYEALRLGNQFAVHREGVAHRSSASHGGGRFIGRGGVWYPGGAHGVGCLIGGGPEVTVHGNLHPEDEAAGVVGRLVA